MVAIPSPESATVTVDMPGVPDPELRHTLLECYLRFSTSKELSDWLQGLDQDSRGTVEDKRQRVREHTQYLTMPRETFPRQTLNYLEPYTTDRLAEICEALGVTEEGNKDDLWRRIYREVGYREGWLRRLPNTIESFDKGLILPFVEWYPVRRRGEYERDYTEPFDSEMLDLVGDECVHPEYPVAHGSTLKIDFHIGRPQQPGVGVEFKRPTSNSDLQRAQGQMDQYLAAYGSNLIVVLLPDALNRAQESLFTDALKAKGITTVVKRPYAE